MKANKARDLQLNYRDPKNLKETVKQLKRFAALNFSNASFVYKNEEKAKLISQKLERLGYETFSRPWSDGDFIVDIQWN